MCTAQNQCVHLADLLSKFAHALNKLRAQFFQGMGIVHGFVGLLLNGQCQTFAGLQNKFTRLGRAIGQNRLTKFFKTQAAQRTLSAHHTDAQSFRLCQCGSQCRFNPNEGQGREGSAQVFNSNSGGRIARHHHGLQVPEGLQLLRDEVATVNDKRIAAFAIGGKPTVCPINKARLRHFCTQGLQHTQATNATVKNANEA